MDTGRRSFLSAALAWLGAVVASLWPRRALSADRRGFSPPTGPARPGVLRLTAYRDPAGPPELRHRVRLYEDCGLMLDEMHAHLSKTGHDVLSDDDPRARLVGFCTFDPAPGGYGQRVVWQAGTTAVRELAARVREDWRSIPGSFGTAAAADDEARAGDDAVSLLCECLMDSRGRTRLAKAYQAGSRERFKRGLGPLPT